MTTSHLLLLFLLPLHVFSLTTCPRQCICHEHSIACSCETSDKSELIISSLGSTYITSLVVHTCDKVTVQNGSFAGVVLVERLSFIAIGRLYFEPHAFKDILQSPRQLVIDECSIPSLAPVAFAGLSHIDHLWFRNSHVETIAMEAFHYLTNIDYIYFHKTKIGRIERRAFSKMYQIDHLYFKDSISIDFIESQAFSGSQIDELIFDGVEINGSHDTFLLNIDSEDVILRNSSVTITPRKDENIVEIKENEQKMSDRCLIESSQFNELSPFKLGCMVLEVTSSTIKRISPVARKTADNSEIVSEPSISSTLNSIIFSNCSIESIDSFAFLNYTLEVLHFNHSSIDNIRPKAVEKSKIQRFGLSGTILKSVEKSAFHKSRIKWFDFLTMDIGVFESEWINDCSIRNMRMIGSKVEKMEKNSFKDTVFEEEFQMDGNRINIMDNDVFNGDNQMSSLLITGNDLSTSIASPTFISSNPSAHPIHFVLANNTLDCSPTDCSTNSFLLNSPKHSNLLFQISGNRCRPPVQSPCVEPRTTNMEEHGVTCRISSLVADCACVSSTSSLPFRFALNVSIVIIGDCEHLVLDQKNADLTQIYIFRTSMLSLYNLPKSLKILKVFHSTVSLLRSGTNSPSKFPQSWQISHSKIDLISPSSLSFLNLLTLHFDHSRIPHIPPHSTRNSSIQSLIIENCHVESTLPLFEISSSLRMEHSIVFSSPRGLGAVRSAQLQNNTLLECCRHPYMDDYRNPMGLDTIELDPRCDLHFYGSRCFVLDIGEAEKNFNMAITSSHGRIRFFLYICTFLLYFLLFKI